MKENSSRLGVGRTAGTLLWTAGILLLMLSGGGCSSSYVPLIYTGSSLNIYNTHWDKFDARMEVGKVYHYSNRRFDRKLHFRVDEILPDGRVLVSRKAEQGMVDETEMEISEECRFLISTSYPYADGTKLREGDYRCIGNGRWTDSAGAVRTLFLLEDVRFPGQKAAPSAAPEAGGKTETDGAAGMKKDTAAPAEPAVKMRRGDPAFTPELFPENSLNIYNTYWDDFTGTLETDRVYRYSNRGFSRSLHYTVQQSEPGIGIVVARQAGKADIGGKYQDMCAESMFLVVSGHSYADGESLRSGDYRCLGTLTYSAREGVQRTAYVLLDTGCPGKIPRDLEKPSEADGKSSGQSISI